VYRLEERRAAGEEDRQRALFERAIDHSEYRNGLMHDLLGLFGGSRRLLVSNLTRRSRWR